MPQITYAVKGMIDYQVDIPVGKATVRVQFTGGSFSKYGNLPAVYATSDPVLQRIIQESEPYRLGRIYQLN